MLLAALNPDVKRIQKAFESRCEEVFRFQQLRLGCDGVAERAQGGNAAGSDHVQVTLTSELLVRLIRDAEYRQ